MVTKAETETWGKGGDCSQAKEVGGRDVECPLPPRLTICSWCHPSVSYGLQAWCEALPRFKFNVFGNNIL